MKKHLFLSITVSCLFATANAQLRVNNNGDVTINRNVEVAGNISVAGTISGAILGNEAGSAASSAGIASQTAHDKLSGMKAVAYYKDAQTAGIVEEGTDSRSAIETQSLAKMHYGLSAEQLAAVYPDLVYELEDGTKAINYMELVPLLVQAIGELNAKVAALEGGGKTRAMAAQATGIASADSDAWAAIGQNAPNPFAVSTTIRLSVPASAQSAQLCIYDMGGKQLRQISIADRGEFSIAMTNEGLDSGMYLYSLIVDGSLIGTRRMIIAK